MWCISPDGDPLDHNALSCSAIIVAPALEGEWAGREEPPIRSPFYGPTAERSHGTQFLFDLMGFFIDRIADNDPVRSEIVGSR